MKRKNLLKFLPIAGVTLLMPALTMVACNEKPIPPFPPVEGNIYIYTVNIKTKSNNLPYFWIGLNVSWDVDLLNCVEWSFVYTVESDQTTWDFSLQRNVAARTGPSGFPEFQFTLQKNGTSQIDEGTTCDFQIHFKYFEQGISSGQLTWEQASQMIHWTWSDPTK